MNRTMDGIRYALGVLGFIVLPPGALFWFLIHPFAHRWRKLGPAITYLLVVLPMLLCGALNFRFRDVLLDANLGTNWVLIAIAGLLCVMMIPLELQYWKHLSIATLAGIPELSLNAEHRGKLLHEGIYGVVRHPRYLSAGLGVIAFALIVNYSGYYLLVLLMMPAGYLLMVLEERELVDRFGEEYRQYQREVPRFIPRRGKR